MIYFWYVLAGIVVLAGLVGVIVPAIPGVPLVFVGLLIAAASAKFSFIGWVAVVVLAALAGISLAIDYFSGVLGAKYGGASWAGLAGALIGTFIGIAYFGVLGLFFGAALGVLAFELIAHRTVKKSVRAAGYTLFSVVAGMIINLTLALTMLVIFVGAMIV